MRAPTLIAAALALPLTLGDCRVESAVVDVITSDTARVVATMRCGALVCFERWIDVAGVRRGVAKACEKSQGDDLIRVEPKP